MPIRAHKKISLQDCTDFKNLPFLSIEKYEGNDVFKFSLREDHVVGNENVVFELSEEEVESMMDSLHELLGEY